MSLACQVRVSVFTKLQDHTTPPEKLNVPPPPPKVFPEERFARDISVCVNVVVNVSAVKLGTTYCAVGFKLRAKKS